MARRSRRIPLGTVCSATAWFVAPLMLCPLVAVLAPGTDGSAKARGVDLLELERTLGVAVEPLVHEWFGAHPPAMALATLFYFGAHLSAVVATACWLAARHPLAFSWFGRVFAVAQLLTACAYVVVPVAPLRMLLERQPSADIGWAGSVQHELAAMPSGHAVFAGVVAYAIWRHGRRRWRWVGPSHVVVTIVVVVATAHHLLIDAAAGLVVAAAAVGIVALVNARRAASRTTPPVEWRNELRPGCPRVEHIDRPASAGHTARSAAMVHQTHRQT